jgi:hypothetical protein
VPRRQLGLAPVGAAALDTDERLSDLVLRADDGALQDLRTQVLAPLADLSAGTREKLIETLRSWLLHHGRREKVAEELFVHPQTVRYRMTQLRQLYGKRLEDPRTVLALTLALGAGRTDPHRTVGPLVHSGAMTVDLAAAADFLAGSARVLDRRRFDVRFGGSDADALLAAVDAYRNPDGGYGWGLEPDLRSRTSQPGGALHAFEAFADAAPTTTPRAVELCEWLAGATLPDGGLPFALPVPDPAACAPFWATADGPGPRCRSPRSSPWPPIAWRRWTRRSPSTRGWPGRPSTASRRSTP